MVYKDIVIHNFERGMNEWMNALYIPTVKSYQSLLLNSYKHGYRVGLIQIFFLMDERKLCVSSVSCWQLK